MFENAEHIKTTKLGDVTVGLNCKENSGNGSISFSKTEMTGKMDGPLPDSREIEIKLQMSSAKLYEFSREIAKLAKLCEKPSYSTGYKD